MKIVTDGTFLGTTAEPCMLIKKEEETHELYGTHYYVKGKNDSFRSKMDACHR